MLEWRRILGVLADPNKSEGWSTVLLLAIEVRVPRSPPVPGKPRWWITLPGFWRSWLTLFPKKSFRDGWIPHEIHFRQLWKIRKPSQLFWSELCISLWSVCSAYEDFICFSYLSDLRPGSSRYGGPKVGQLTRVGSRVCLNAGSQTSLGPLRLFQVSALNFWGFSKRYWVRWGVTVGDVYYNVSRSFGVFPTQLLRDDESPPSSLGFWSGMFSFKGLSMPFWSFDIVWLESLKFWKALSSRIFENRTVECVESMVSGVRLPGFESHSFPFLVCMTLGKFFKFSDLSFLTYKTWIVMVSFS